MKFVHILAGMEETSGIANAACRIAAAQAAAGHEVTIAATECGGRLCDPGDRVKVHLFPRSFPRRLCRSAAMRRALPGLLAGADAAIVHSMWLWPAWHGVRAAARAGVRALMMPHGCLDPVKLAYHGMRKRIAGALMDRRSCAICHAVIATEEREREWIAAWAPRGTRIETVPLGVEIPDLRGGADAFGNAAQDGSESVALNLLYIGRLHPLKCVEALVEAAGGMPDVRLAIAGRDECGYGERLRMAYPAGGNPPPRIRYEGCVTEERKRRLLAECDALVLPSLSENFGLVVAEALAHGKPVVTTDGAPAWKDVASRGCGIWLDGFVRASPASRVAMLRNAIAELAAKPESMRTAMGRAGRQWMEESFSWSASAAKMAQIAADGMPGVADTAGN